MGPRVSTDILAERLAGMIGPRASVARAVLDQHGQSESHYRSLPPDIVVFPETTQEVAEIVKLCASAGMPIVPFGAGTSLEGNAAAVAGGVCFDF
ncbi:FAD-binding protein, partial [Herbaspirillum sp. HC18]